MCSSSSQLFTVTSVAGFLCLLTFCRESLSILSTRAFSCVTREAASLSSITCVGLSPDGAVIFAVDRHHHSLLRMEVVSGNCRYFPLLKDICCKYTPDIIPSHLCYFFSVRTYFWWRDNPPSRGQEDSGLDLNGHDCHHPGKGCVLHQDSRQLQVPGYLWDKRGSYPVQDVVLYFKIAHSF